MIKVDANILRRAEELEKAGFDSYDAVHLACAEEAQADVFLTTDDQIIRTAEKAKVPLAVLVENPVRYLEEV